MTTRKTREFVIYYGDGSTYSNEDGPPEDAPARNVQIIVQPHRQVGVEIVSSADNYVWMDDRGWWGVDRDGMMDYLIEPGWKKVLYGRTLLQSEYDQIVKAANLEKDAWLERERRISPGL